MVYDAKIDIIRSSAWLLACTGLLSDEESAAVIRKVFELEDLISDKKLPPNHWGAARMNYDIAKLYARLNDTENTYKYLRHAAEAARAFDTRPETQSYTSILLGEVKIKRSDFETADTRDLCEIMREKWLFCEEFDCIRNTKEFQSIEKQLSTYKPIAEDK